MQIYEEIHTLGHLGVEDIPFRGLLKHPQVKAALLYPSQDRKYHAAGRMTQM
jgi:hypothetical protein